MTRQPESSKDGQPHVSDTSYCPLSKDKDEERKGRNNHIEREKRTDARGEELAHKQVHIEPMLH